MYAAASVRVAGEAATGWLFLNGGRAVPLWQICHGVERVDLYTLSGWLKRQRTYIGVSRYIHARGYGVRCEDGSLRVGRRPDVSDRAVTDGVVS